MSKCKILSSNSIYQGHIISVSNDQIEMPDGRILQRDVVRHPGAVVIVPVDPDGAIYFIKQFRYAINQEILELPAGCLEDGEQPLLCAQRELQEEIGKAATSWQELGSIFPAPGFCDEIQHIFLARQFSESKLPMDEDEVMEVVLVPAAQINQLIRENKIVDAKTLAALQLAVIKNLL